MSQVQDSRQHPLRRSDDFTDKGSVPTAKDAWNLAIEIRDRLEKVERRQKEQATAFPINDLNTPDYDGHRKDHVAMREEQKTLTGYKTDITKKILGLVVLALLGLTLSGMLNRLAESFKHL